MLPGSWVDFDSPPRHSLATEFLSLKDRERFEKERDVVKELSQNSSQPQLPAHDNGKRRDSEEFGFLDSTSSSGSPPRRFSMKRNQSEPKLAEDEEELGAQELLLQARALRHLQRLNVMDDEGPMLPDDLVPVADPMHGHLDGEGSTMFRPPAGKAASDETSKDPDTFRQHFVNPDAANELKGKGAVRTLPVMPLTVPAIGRLRS